MAAKRRAPHGQPYPNLADGLRPLSAGLASDVVRCSSASSNQARFELDYQADGSLTMLSLKTGRYVRVGSNDRLRAEGLAGDGDRFTQLHLR